jgi:hypothetical protein
MNDASWSLLGLTECFSNGEDLTIGALVRALSEAIITTIAFFADLISLDLIGNILNDIKPSHL